jgi:hypothetical protein
MLVAWQVSNILAASLCGSAAPWPRLDLASATQPIRLTVR